MTLGSQRHLFDVPDDVAYFDCAKMSPNLRSVRQAAVDWLDRTDAPWTITARDFFTYSERLRSRAAELVGGDTDGIALIPSVSYGMGLATRNLPVEAGQTILTLDEQFPSNVYPWRELAGRVGAEVVTVPRSADGWTAALLDRIDERVAVVAVPNCHWADGTVVDLVQIREATRSVGAALVVDGTQSIGAFPIDVGTVQPDVLVVATYKWMLGPYSLGIAWFAPHLREGVPLEFNWITREGSEDFGALASYVDGFADGARRYDVGERSNFLLVPMATAAIEQLLAWGVDEVSRSIGVITGEIESASRQAGLEPVPADRRVPHMLGVRVPSGVPAGLTETLAEHRIHVSVRGDSIRISPHLWITDHDLSRLLEVLTDLG